MDTNNVDSQEIGNISSFYKLTYEAWREGKIAEIDSVLPAFDKNISFDDFKSLLEIISSGSITIIGSKRGFLEKELFITCMESKFLFTNMRLFVSKITDINKDFDCFPISQISSFEYYKNTRRIIFYIMGKKFIYGNITDSALQNVPCQLKNNSLYISEYTSINEDLVKINFNNASNIYTNYVNKTSHLNKTSYLNKAIDNPLGSEKPTDKDSTSYAIAAGTGVLGGIVVGLATHFITHDKLSFPIFIVAYILIFAGLKDWGKRMMALVVATVVAAVFISLLKHLS